MRTPLAVLTDTFSVVQIYLESDISDLAE